ncbi:MAG: helix-turn-helix transcriptional regulator [Gemmatimonadota bacterium]
MRNQELDQQIGGLAALEEPIRRSLYFYVAYRHRDVSRDEAAQAVGISRELAGFHLDRLVAEGLLETSFRRLSGRSGPGAGRPAKLYRRSERELEVSLPQRSYKLAGRILATAMDSAAQGANESLAPTAREIGAEIGREARARAGSRPGKRRLVAGTIAVLTSHGYEPEQQGNAIRLRNCPFHYLVSEHRQLVCGMNLALIEGLVAGLDVPGVEPRLDPKPGMCCVALKLR